MDPSSSKHLHLHYTTPAVSWDEALPLGNGRLGCLVYGRPGKELIQLNEDSVWYGGPQDRIPDSRSHLPRLRELIRAGKHAEAEELVRTAFYANPSSMRHYEPLGTLMLEFSDSEHAVGGIGDVQMDDSGEDVGEVRNYKRSLDLETATARASYARKGTSIQSDILASYPDNVIAIRISASRTCRFHVRLTRLGEVEWETQEYLDSVTAVDTNRLLMKATPGGANSNRLAAVLGVRCDDGIGTVKPFGGTLMVEATVCTIVLGAQTTFRHADPGFAAMAEVSKALDRGWLRMLERHITDYKSLFHRTSLRMWPDNSSIPTDKRIKESRDPGLVALYHNYGRYLMISSSRDGEKALPATLQGIWNPSFAPAWGSKYTININIQMNYWPVAACNLMECALPLVSLLERMAERGKVTARKMYGCKGWCAHHNTDIWADTAPQDRWMPATLWPLSGVWLVNDCIGMLQHKYDHNLHERLFSSLQGSIDFLLDFLISDSSGKFLVTNPSLSPENTFITSSGKEGILCEGSAMDMSIVRLAFENFLWSCGRISPSNSLISSAMSVISCIQPLIINDQGLIQEWGLADYTEKEPGHRHVSHLFALYPHNAISPMKSTALCEAAKKVLDRRAAHGGGHTGWSRAWLLNMHARLLDDEGCGKHMDLLLENSTLPNMLNTHPPFQIDGNFGACAGVLECLVQSTIMPDWPYRLLIRILPACPKEWDRGEMKGVRVKNGWKVSFDWKKGRKVDHVEVEGTEEGNSVATVLFPDGERVEVDGLGCHEVSRGKTPASRWAGEMGLPLP